MHRAADCAGETREVDGLVVPDIVADKYKVLQRLGGGGMGDVYEVEHLRLGRHFAIKFMRHAETARSGPVVRRFEREARTVARIENEHVVGVLDYGETPGGTPFLVMELLHGEDLRGLLRRLGQLPVQRACNIVLDACRGASAIHAAGVVHRDLKPENLFVSSRSTGEDLCKVLDFGVVKTDDTASTEPGRLIGTVRYMAPEQLIDGAAVSPATDVYALGAILHECLAGTAPFAADNVQQVMFKILNDAPPALAGLPSVPAALDEAIRRAMSKAPEERFASADDFGRSITAVLKNAGREGQSETTGFDGTPSGRAWKPLRAAHGARRSAVLGVAMTASFLLGSWTTRSCRSDAVANGRAERATVAPLGERQAALPESSPGVGPEPRRRDAPSGVPQPEPAVEQAATATGTDSRSPDHSRSARRAGRSGAQATRRDAPALFDVENPYDGQ